MNHRDAALAAMRGQPVQHIPFIGRMDLWFAYQRAKGTLPPQYRKATLYELQRELGIGIQGHESLGIPFFRVTYPGVEVTRKVEGGSTIVQYQTPYGTLTSRDQMAEELADAAWVGARVAYPFRDANDYDALQYLLEHARVVDNFDAYARLVDEIGTDGLALPFAGYLPAHELMLHLMGYVTFYLELYEHPQRIEALEQALTAQFWAILELAGQCAAQAIEVGGNYDEAMTPPPIFDRFFAPYYRQAGPFLEARGRIMVVHGDGEMKVLLTRLMDCGVPVVEALTPKPMTSIDIAATRQLWGDKVALWGGLAGTLLTEEFTDQEFEDYMQRLFAAVAPGQRFILGFGDNVPTDAPFRRVQQAADYWARHGAYPLAGGR